MGCGEEVVVERIADGVWKVCVLCGKSHLGMDILEWVFVCL